MTASDDALYRQGDNIGPLQRGENPAGNPDVKRVTAADDALDRLETWRKLVNEWTDACEEVYDAAKEAGDDFPALAWMLAERGHGVGAEFGFALDALATVRDQLRWYEDRDESLCERLSICDIRLAKAKQRVEDAEGLLRRIRQWDVLDTTADGPYWRGEIDAVLKENS